MQESRKRKLVLQSDGQYVFKHDNSVPRSHDLVLHQAFSWFHLGNLDNCIERIQQLDAAFSASPGAADIEEILLNKLESLQTQFD